MIAYIGNSKNKNFIYNLTTVSIDTINSIIKMLTDTQNQIVSFLLRHPEEQVTIRGLAKRLGKSYTLVYNNLIGLEKKDIIRKQDVPPAKTIALHEFAPTNTLIDTEIKIREEFLKKHPWLEVMVNDMLSSIDHPFFIFIVFGSYAKGTQTKRSDIDFLIITKTKDQIDYIETQLRKAYTRVKKNIILIDVDNFREMISHPNALNVGNEARKYHIILYGVEQYYQLMRRTE